MGNVHRPKLSTFPPAKTELSKDSSSYDNELEAALKAIVNQASEKGVHLTQNKSYTSDIDILPPAFSLY